MPERRGCLLPLACASVGCAQVVPRLRVLWVLLCGPTAVAGGLSPVLGCQCAQRDRVERGDARLQAEAVGEERDGLFDLAACQHVIADDEAFGGLACIRASDLACPTLDRRHRSSTQPWGSAS